MTLITSWPLLLACGLLVAAASAFAQDAKPAEPKVWTLPKPVTEGGKPLMEALRDRRTSREFSPKKLPDQVLSNLLWAAWGINRPDGRRTAPSAMNRQEIDVYLATADGLWLFDAKAHALTQVLAEDIRALTGTQPFVKDAPLNLIFVADLSRMGNAPDEDKKVWAAADTGFISQNVYLFCASENLATVVRGLIDKPALARAMKLRADQSIILAQTVGYPAEPQPSRPAQGPEAGRAEKPAFKGMELYSWKPEGKDWHFSLLPGTNRLKSREEMTAPGSAIVGLESLKPALSKLAKGELLGWQNLEGEPVPEAIRKDIEALCRQLEVKLSLIER